MPNKPAEEFEKANTFPQQPVDLFTWENYHEFIQQHDHLRSQRGSIQLGRGRIPAGLNKQVFMELPQMYRARLPVYLLARCPICNQNVTEPVDTFSLMGVGWWWDEPLGFGWFGRSAVDVDTQGSHLNINKTSGVSFQTTCPCVRALTYGVNLQGQQPSDVTNNFVWLSSEQPGLFKPFMDLPDSYAVISTLSVGEWGASSLQAKYTAWFVTYFNKAPQTFDPLFPDNNQPSQPHFKWDYDHMDYDLVPWMEAGKLFWLDGNTLSQNLQAPIFKLRGVTGRWCVWGRKLKLLPTTITGHHLMNSNHMAYAGLAAKEKLALTKRDVHGGVNP